MVVRNVRAEYQAAQAVAEQLLVLAQRQHDPALLLGAHYALGHTLYLLRRFCRCPPPPGAGDRPLRPPVACDPAHLPWVGDRRRGELLRPSGAWSCGILGYPDQAVQRSQEALTLAHALAHPFSLASALLLSARPLLLAAGSGRRPRRRPRPLALATEHGFARFVALGSVSVRAGRWPHRARAAEGIAQMRQGLAALRATGAALALASFLAAAEAYGPLGQVEEGLHLLAEALPMVDTRWGVAGKPSLYRLTGSCSCGRPFQTR